MRKFHGIAEGGVTKRPGIFEAISKDSTISSPAKRNAISSLTQSFQPAVFKAKLIRWIVHDNVAFD
jgi:hypothetical protein